VKYKACRYFKVVMILSIITACIIQLSLLLAVCGYESRPICGAATYNAKPIEHFRYGYALKYMDTPKKTQTYRYIYESSDALRFNTKTEQYLKEHPTDMVYISTQTAEEPQLLVIFSNDSLDEKWFRPEKNEK